LTKVNVVIIAKALLFWGLFQGLLLASMAGFMTLPRLAVAVTAGGSITIAVIGLTWLFLRNEKLTMSDLGMTFGKGSLKRFGLGLAAGVALFGCFFLVYFWLTPVAPEGVDDFNFLDAVVLTFFSFVMLSAMEEVAFRGYFLRKLESAVGIRVAIYASSIAFGLYHGLTVDSLTGPAVWGLFYGVLAYWSKGLAVPIGFHAGVNLIQAFFSQKEKYANGIWTIDTVEKITPFTVGQVTIGLQVLLFIAGVVLVEVYISRKGAVVSR
jgi:membrane protease YdiL (CAAX protease family)